MLQNTKQEGRNSSQKAPSKQFHLSPAQICSPALLELLIAVFYQG